MYSVYKIKPTGETVMYKPSNFTHLPKPAADPKVRYETRTGQKGHRRQMYLGDDIIRILKALGEGNISKGLRRAVYGLQDAVEHIEQLTVETPPTHLTATSEPAHTQDGEPTPPSLTTPTLAAPRTADTTPPLTAPPPPLPGGKLPPIPGKPTQPSTEPDNTTTHNEGS